MKFSQCESMMAVIDSGDDDDEVDSIIIVERQRRLEGGGKVADESNGDCYYEETNHGAPPTQKIFCGRSVMLILFPPLTAHLWREKLGRSKVEMCIGTIPNRQILRSNKVFSSPTGT